MVVSDINKLAEDLEKQELEVTNLSFLFFYLKILFTDVSRPPTALSHLKYTNNY